MVPTGIDKEKLLLQFERLEESLSRLQEIRNEFDQSAKKEDLLDVARRRIQISIEECINIASHIISGLNLKRPDTYRQIFFILEEKGIISKELSFKMQQLATFRNRLVHLYWEVEQAEVIQRLNELDVFTHFIEIISKFLNTGGV